VSTVYTIGHSTHTLERFLELLGLHRIEAIADVRSQPYSGFNPQFNREDLRRFLWSKQITYAFLGQELGARSDDESCYDEDKVQYDRIAQTTLFQSGLGRIEAGANKYRLALLCAEKEPLDCHRTILVARHLEERGISVTHILSDGGAETHANTMHRLIRRLGLAEGDLFQSREAALTRSYEVQGSRIAYTRAKSRCANGHLMDDQP